MHEHADQLPSALPVGVFLPLLIAGVIVAAAYGSSFLLPEYLQAQGFNRTAAGGVISTGMITTIVCCCLAGWSAQRIGVLPTVIGAAMAMAIAMLCFAWVQWDVRAAYVGGLMLGVGWSVFYILAPLLIIHHLRPSARLQYLTIMSGAQMAGLGLATPLGHWVVHETGSYGFFYGFFAAACLVAALSLALARRAVSGLPQSSMNRMCLRPVEVWALLRGGTAIPILMIVLAACIFSGLSTYQASYAEARHLTPDNFFVTFTLTSVLLRFSVARFIGRLPLSRLAMGLFLFTSLALGLFLLNENSPLVYGLATVVFAIGYGLSYSTLNSMAANQAEAAGLSPSVSSQVFTLGYFSGLFGFPLIGAAVLHQWGIDWVLWLLLGVALGNLLLVTAVRGRKAVAV